MTLQLGGPSWALQSFQLGVNEISSALVICNLSGSYFNRREYSDLIEKICKGLNLHIRQLPKWLQNVNFSRRSTIHGASMRSISVPDSMSDLKITEPSGIATFVVLCSRYTEDKTETMELVHDLLCGRLGGLVGTDGRHSDMPYTLKPQLLKFVEASLQADIDSEVSIKARECMAKLIMFGDLDWHDDYLDIGRLQATKEILSEMLGGTALDEQMAETDITSVKQGQKSSGWARIHNTLRLSSAYIGIAAASQGADVVVECITSSGSKYFPEKPRQEMQQSTFLVRLWLKQPPEDVYGLLRHSKFKGGGKLQTQDDGRGDLVVFGGSKEILVAIAKTLDFEPASIAIDAGEGLMTLWEEGSKFAQRLSWTVARNRPERNTDFFLLTGFNDKEPIRGCAAPLAQTLRSLDIRLSGVARTVAKIADSVYCFEDYGLYLHDDSELVRAMEFVIVAMTVQVLRNTTIAMDNSLDQYALHLSCLVPRKGVLRTLIPDTLHGGIAHKSLIWAASTLWGGASFRSQGNQSAYDDSVGAIAPHCTILLDFIRDPLLFLTNGPEGKILSLWRGATPMLPREPQSNYIRSAFLDLSATRLELEPNTGLSEDSATAADDVSGSMLMTFEPYISNPTTGVFCCWYSGRLAAELSPDNMFRNVVNRWAERLCNLQLKRRHHQRTPAQGMESFPPPRRLRPRDLLQLKNFRLSAFSSAYVVGLIDPTWELFAAGCCDRRQTVFHHPHPDTPETPITPDEVHQVAERAEEDGCVQIIVLPSSRSV